MRNGRSHWDGLREGERKEGRIVLEKKKTCRWGLQRFQGGVVPEVRHKLQLQISLSIVARWSITYTDPLPPTQIRHFSPSLLCFPFPSRLAPVVVTQSVSLFPGSAPSAEAGGQAGSQSCGVVEGSGVDACVREALSHIPLAAGSRPGLRSGVRKGVCRGTGGEGRGGSPLSHDLSGSCAHLGAIHFLPENSLSPCNCRRGVGVGVSARGRGREEKGGGGEGERSLASKNESGRLGTASPGLKS